LIFLIRIPFILLFLVCSSLAVFFLSACGNVQNDRGTQQDQTAYGTSQKIINKQGYTVKVKIPILEKNRNLPPLELEEENFDPDQVARMFFRHPERVRRMQKDGTVPVIQYYSDLESDKYLEVYPHGFSYREDRRYDTLLNEKKFSSQQAVTMAKEYIAKHGGLPAGAYLKENSPITYRGKVIGYKIVFTPEPVKGVDFFQNLIMVEITPKGLINYLRTWRTVKRIREDRARPILSPEEALDAFLKINNIAIEEMSLAYFGEVGYKHQPESIPIWIAWVSRNGTKAAQMMIDAYSGRKVP